MQAQAEHKVLTVQPAGLMILPSTRFMNFPVVGSRFAILAACTSLKTELMLTPFDLDAQLPIFPRAVTATLNKGSFIRRAVTADCVRGILET